MDSPSRKSPRTAWSSKTTATSNDATAKKRGEKAMPNELPIPLELQHLIEKREDRERRKKTQRSEPERRKADLGPLGALESIADIDELPLEDRRSRGDRRISYRRKTPRRKR
jgi:hypothetical protein